MHLGLMHAGQMNIKYSEVFASFEYFIFLKTHSEKGYWANTSICCWFSEEIDCRTWVFNALTGWIWEKMSTKKTTNSFDIYVLIGTISLLIWTLIRRLSWIHNPYSTKLVLWLVLYVKMPKVGWVFCSQNENMMLISAVGSRACTSVTTQKGWWWDKL